MRNVTIYEMVKIIMNMKICRHTKKFVD